LDVFSIYRKWPKAIRRKGPIFSLGTYVTSAFQAVT